MKLNPILSLIGNTQKILVRERTFSLNEDSTPYGFLNIFAIRVDDKVNEIEVSLNMVSKGESSDHHAVVNSTFSLDLNANLDLATEVLLQQLEALAQGYNVGIISDDEVEVIHTWREKYLEECASNTTTPIFITQDFMAQKLGQSYKDSENFVQATEFMYSETLKELQSLFEKLMPQEEVAHV